MDNTPYSEEIVAKARALRQAGTTYAAIDTALGLPRGVAWRILNREASRKNLRDAYRLHRLRAKSKSPDPFLDPVNKNY
jgi:hypothetical protein